MEAARRRLEAAAGLEEEIILLLLVVVKRRRLEEEILLREREDLRGLARELDAVGGHLESLWVDLDGGHGVVVHLGGTEQARRGEEEARRGEER